MDNWDEIRTAFQVARKGTVSGAADELGVHHATVIRHIDALEGRLGVKLFQRHARGYTATEAGQDLLQVASATDDQFTQLVGRIKGRGEGVSGELVITSLSVGASVLTPILVDFQAAHPDVRVRYRTGEKVLRLEYGEAHVAIRAGAMPNEPDNVVQPFMVQRVCIAASKAYISKNGMPDGVEALKQHKFVAFDVENSRAPFLKWLRAHVPDSCFTFRANDSRQLLDAILAGAGIGFVLEREMAEHPDLVEVLPSLDDWSVPLWLVTHVDLHRTTKVQTFLKFLKARIKDIDP